MMDAKTEETIEFNSFSFIADTSRGKTSQDQWWNHGNPCTESYGDVVFLYFSMLAGWSVGYVKKHSTEPQESTTPLKSIPQLSQSDQAQGKSNVKLTKTVRVIFSLPTSKTQPVGFIR
jgi:hypothetical protein